MFGIVFCIKILHRLNPLTIIELIMAWLYSLHSLQTIFYTFSFIPLNVVYLLELDEIN